MSSENEDLIKSWSDFGKKVNKNIKKIVLEEKAKMQDSFEHVVKRIEHGFEMSR
jgi:hypothetical protein